MTVREVEVKNFIGRWFARQGWGGVTLPGPSGVLILLWPGHTLETRFHERYGHAEQAKERGWRRWWRDYLGGLWEGYRFARARIGGGRRGRRASLRWAYENHPMEIDAEKRGQVAMATWLSGQRSVRADA